MSVFLVPCQRSYGCGLMHVALLILFWGRYGPAGGFGFAGMYIVCESWLNDKATNATRGQLLSLYMIVNMGAWLRQLLIGFGDWRYRRF